MDAYYPHTLRHPDTATVEFEDFTAVCIKGCDALNNHDKIHGVTSRNKYLVAAQICNFSPQTNFTCEQQYRCRWLKTPK
jgi:hypothetical protein